MHLSVITSIAGLLIGIAVAWGAMRATVKLLGEQLSELKKTIPDMASLQTQVHGLGEELDRLREVVEAMRDSLTSLQTEVRVEAARRRTMNGRKR